MKYLFYLCIGLFSKPTEEIYRGEAIKFRPDLDKEIIQLVNHYRTDPNKTVDFITLEDGYSKSTQLIIDKDLVKGAKEHCIKLAKAGRLFHARGNFYENCLYHYESNADVIIKDYIIDEGVPSLGHRKSILGHKTYTINATRIGSFTVEYKGRVYNVIRII